MSNNQKIVVHWKRTGKKYSNIPKWHWVTYLICNVKWHKMETRIGNEFRSKQFGSEKDKWLPASKGYFSWNVYWRAKSFFLQADIYLTNRRNSSICPRSRCLTFQPLIWLIYVLLTFFLTFLAAMMRGICLQIKKLFADIPIFTRHVCLITQCHYKRKGYSSHCWPFKTG